jgi:hypothetical protein
MRKVYFTLLSVIVPFLGFTKDDDKKGNQSEDIKQTTEAKAEGDTKSPFTFSGYLDSYYIGNFNRPQSRSNTGVANGRAFDVTSGQFQLGLVQTKMTYANDKSEAVVDLTFGPNADLGNYGNLVSVLNPDYTGMALAIKQAYFTYNFSDKFSMTAGQFGTHIGYEVIDAPVNFNYSLSNLINNGPFYHTGLKATYSFSDRASLMLGVVNNVDGLGDNNRQKGFISQLFFSPVDNWNVYLNYMGSNEASQDVPSVAQDKAFYSIVDLTTSYQITEKFLLGVNAAYGSQKGDFQGGGGPSSAQTWGGAAVYANVALTDIFALGARYENFNNKSGVRGLVNSAGEGTKVNSFTLTGNFTLADGHVFLKPELRIDSYPKLGNSSESQQFEDSNGNFSKNSQTTLGMAFIYAF